MTTPASRGLLMACLAWVLVATGALAQGADPNACDDPSESPNVIVGNLHQIQRWGTVNGITAYSVGTTSCNVGTCWLNWIAGSDNNQHPTIGQNMFRLENGRFEHIGQSWLKHGFYALSENVCSPDCLPVPDGEHLGVNCSDPYSADLNGRQTRLGPKFEVNALTGYHPHPVTNQSVTGDAIFKRLQVRDADIDPALHPTARYFVEGQYVAEDDAGAGNGNDNASYRPIDIRKTGGVFIATLVGQTQRTRPGILAWQDADPTVSVVIVDDPEGGRFYVAGQATDLGGGNWAYEYAVQNLTSMRALRSFAVPVPDDAILTDAGFHDVDYHSGEPFDLTDWPVVAAGGAVTWQTETHAVNPLANALRWGTLYNFRFTVNLPPATGFVHGDFFAPGRPGDADRMIFPFLAPAACDGDGRCDPGESCLSCPGDCSDAGPDIDADGTGYCEDCDEGDASKWGDPTEVPLHFVAKGAGGELSLRWDPPADAGGTPPRFEALRSTVASDFLTAANCLVGSDPSLRSLQDPDAPVAGPRLFYLVRARGRCAPDRFGTTGGNSFGVERSAATCP